MVQTTVLTWMICKTNCDKEDAIADDRIRKWGRRSIRNRPTLELKRRRRDYVN
ncbi:hypothetical protein YC2023_105027 [Brassica napus]